MPTEADLLAGIVAHPAEFDRWLILSDWLEDHRDPRAELARLRHALQTEPNHPQREQRLARQLALLADHAPVVPTWTNSIGMDFALILPGTFQMGSPVTEEERDDDEVLHPVTLTQPFFLGTFPVTVGQFQQFVTATTYQTEAERGNGAYGLVGGEWKRDVSIAWRNPGFEQEASHPVVCVSWNDAVAMVEWLNQTGDDSHLIYSLPTESQWEYACRAGSEKAYFWGDDATRLGEYAWFEENAENRTHPVATKQPNPWGLWHMNGHVWEWCVDWYDDYSSEAVEDPSGPATGSHRVVRGGSWRAWAEHCRAACRSRGAPTACSSYLGLRLARVSVR